MIICNAFVSQLLWFRRVRTNLTALFIVSIFINIGMWFERFVIIVSDLAHDFDPDAWGTYYPMVIDAADHRRLVRLVLPPLPGLHPRDALAVDRGGQGSAAASPEARDAYRGPPLR